MDSEQRLREEIEHVRAVLRTLIVWIASTAGSPLSHNDAKQLLERLPVPEPTAADQEPQP